MSFNKQRYKKLCETYDIPLFSQYFWLDGVSYAGEWDVIIIEENENVLATLPYYIKDNGKEKEIRKAPLTQNNGVFFFYPQGLKYERMLAFEHKVLDKIIDEIEKLNILSYRQYFHHTFNNWLPFYWRGYSQTTRYTYIIKNTVDIEEIYRNFSGNIRNNIKKANRLVDIIEDINYKEFYDLNVKTFERQGIPIPYSFDLFEKLYKNLEKQKCVKIYSAIDNEGNTHSAALFVYDSNSVYYLLSGSEEKFRSSQSLTLLIFEGIKLAKKLGLSFDFEGSMKKNIEKLFREFGAEQVPYFDISKNFRL